MSTVADAFYMTVHDAPGGAESLAPRLSMSSAVLRNKADPKKSSNKATLDDADNVMSLTGDYRILDALAKNHGRVCIPVQSAMSSSDMAVLEIITTLWTSNGDLGTDVHSALADHRVDQAEVKRIEASAYVVVQSIQVLVARLRGMAEK